MIDKLLAELQRIMPLARWHVVPGTDAYTKLRASMDLQASLSCVNGRAELSVFPLDNDRAQVRLFLPNGAIEPIRQASIPEMADQVRHVLLWGYAHFTAQTSQRAREALGGYHKDSDPHNPFIPPYKETP